MNKIKETYSEIYPYSEYFLQQDSLTSHAGPFFYLGNDTTAQSIQTASPKEVRHEGIKRFSLIEDSDGIFLLLLFCFALFVHVFRRGMSFFKENARMVFSVRHSSNLFNQATITEVWFDSLLMFQTMLIYSIVLFVYFFENDDSGGYTGSVFLSVISFVLLFIGFNLIKYLVHRFIAYLFDVKQIFEVWVRGYIVVVEMLGLISFVPLLLLIYFDYYHNVLFLVFLLLFLISRLIIIYRSVIFFLEKGVNFLYLIAYLCTVEIIPYILLYNGLSYLYKIEVTSIL